MKINRLHLTAPHYLETIKPNPQSYFRRTFDYLKYLAGRNHIKYGPSAAMVYYDNFGIAD